VSAGRPPPSLREAYRAFRVLPTRWGDNDIYGHVNNVVHYAFFDTAVNGWLIERGALDPYEGDRIGLVVETNCRYFRAIAFPDVVTAGLRVARIGTSSVRYDVGLFRDEETDASAEGYFIHVYVDRLTRRPTPLNTEFRRALAAIGGDGAPPREDAT
jgi:acyl-CoA thioester hydrolase